MPSDDTVSRQYSRAVGEIFKDYHEDRLEKCVERAQTLLDDVDLPRYHRIKTLCVLAAVVKEYADANACYREAKILWQMSSNHYPPGSNSKADRSLDELKVMLDSLHSELQRIMPRDEGLEFLEYDEFEADDEGSEVDPEELEARELLEREQQELAEAEDDDPEALAEADRQALEGLHLGDHHSTAAEAMQVAVPDEQAVAAPVHEESVGATIHGEAIAAEPSVARFVPAPMMLWVEHAKGANASASSSAVRKNVVSALRKDFWGSRR